MDDGDGLLQGLVGFGGGFLKGMNDAEDRKYKRMEFDAKMKAAAADEGRKDVQNQVEMFKAHIRKDPNAPGGFSDRPLTPDEVYKEDAEAVKGGLLAPKRDEVGHVQGKPEHDPNSPQMIGAKNKQTNATNSIDLRKDVVDRREHENVLRRLNSSPGVKQRLAQYQNLENSLNLLANADHITPQQFHEAQQSIRSNLGIKGTSGIGEREETYLKSIGLQAESFKQFLTGVPGNIKPNDPLLAHVKNLAALEQQNIRNQFGKSIKAATSGHDSMYSRRPDLMDDLRSAVSAQGDQISGGGSSKPATVIQNGHTYTLNPETGEYE